MPDEAPQTYTITSGPAKGQVVPVPDIATLERWDWEDEHESLDGCNVEPDGTCEHGYPSWMRKLGLI